jgi:TPR repeat protein
LSQGQLYISGEGVPEDHDRATVLFKQACDGGEKDACARLAER